MNILSNVEIRYIVAIDIETVRISEDFGDLSEDYQTAWEYKHKHEGEIPVQEELSDLWRKQASLYAEFSKICAVSVVFLDKSGEKLICKGIVNNDEKIILEELSNLLNKISDGSPKFRLAGHASNWFDFPFLCKRYIINQIEIPRILDDTDKKPWETLNIDTNSLWKMGKQGPGSSLQALCVSLGIPTSKADMVGDEVGREFFKGNLEGIKEYCNKDAIATFNILRRFKYQNIFMFEDVHYLDDSIDTNDSIQNDGILNILAMTKDFSSDVKNGIREKLINKKVLKKEWSIIEDIVYNIYVNNEMFKSDSEDVANQKRAEVEAFFKELKEEKNG